MAGETSNPTTSPHLLQPPLPQALIAHTVTITRPLVIQTLTTQHRTNSILVELLTGLTLVVMGELSQQIRQVVCREGLILHLRVLELAELVMVTVAVVRGGK